VEFALVTECMPWFGGPPGHLPAGGRRRWRSWIGRDRYIRIDFRVFLLFQTGAVALAAWIACRRVHGEGQLTLARATVIRVYGQPASGGPVRMSASGAEPCGWSHCYHWTLAALEGHVAAVVVQVRTPGGFEEACCSFEMVRRAAAVDGARCGLAVKFLAEFSPGLDAGLQNLAFLGPWGGGRQSAV